MTDTVYTVVDVITGKITRPWLVLRDIGFKIGETIVSKWAKEHYGKLGKNERLILIVGQQDEISLGDLSDYDLVRRQDDDTITILKIRS